MYDLCGAAIKVYGCKSLVFHIASSSLELLFAALLGWVRYQNSNCIIFLLPP